MYLHLFRLHRCTRWIAATGILVLLTAPAACADPGSLEAQRELFRDTLKSVRKGNWKRERYNIARLGGYPLHGYLYDAGLRATPSEFDDHDVATLLDRYAGTPLADRIRMRWLQYLGYKKRWSSFLRFYEGGNYDHELRCKYAEALRRQGRATDSATEIEKIWLTGRPLPDSCDNLMYGWLRSSGREEELRWARAKLAMAEGESTLVNFLLRPVEMHARLRTLLQDPLQFTVAVPHLRKHPHRQAIAEYTLHRIARRDYEIANTLWLTHRRTLGLSKATNSAIRQQIARQLLADDKPGALGWLIKHDPEGEDPYLLEWRVKLALRAGRWKKVRQYIEMLPGDYRATPQWRYWYARSIFETGNAGERRRAAAPLRTLAAERGYYSFMSAQLLDQPYQMKTSVREDRQLMQTVALHPGIVRARELFAIDEQWLSRVEWSEAVKTMDDPHQYAAARLAANWGWHNTAIKTVSRSGELDDLTLRFPLAFQQRFDDAAELHNLDRAWLFSVARQESAFDPRAVSHAGARGLMQLMPGTANLVARKIGTRVDQQRLHDPAVNVQLGSHYLAQLLADYGGNRVLATAAYNAGPGRVDRALMRQQKPVSVEVWIETLPYTETRGYVRNILAYSVIYSRMLGDFESPMVRPHERVIDPDALLHNVPDRDRVEKLKALRQTLLARND